MNKGTLGITKTCELETVSTDDYITSLYETYKELIQDNEQNLNYIHKLDTDDRFLKLGSGLINMGANAKRIELITFKVWYLWAVNEYGEELATKYLEDYLNNEEVEVVMSLWILGIEIEGSMTLDNGISIVSLYSMPHSRDRFTYSGINNHFSSRTSMPKACLSKKLNIDKIYNNFTDDANYTKILNEIHTAFHDTSLILNIITGISCIPFITKSYFLNTTPPGIFTDSSYQYDVTDLFGDVTNLLTEDKIDEINQCITAFNKSGEKDFFQTVLTRFSQAKRKHSLYDKILDLGIVIEMLLLDSNKNDNIAFTFRLRGSWYIGVNHEERQHLYNMLKSLYEFRSSIAHSGKLKENDIIKANELYPELLRIAEMIIKKRLIEGKPNWDELILGKPKDE